VGSCSKEHQVTATAKEPVNDVQDVRWIGAVDECVAFCAFKSSRPVLPRVSGFCGSCADVM
jgi:hypothetical protein